MEDRHAACAAFAQVCQAEVGLSRVGLYCHARHGHLLPAHPVPMADSKLLGVILIVLGALLLLGYFHIPYLEWVVGVGLLVVGLLLLTGRMPGGTILGVVGIVLGILVLLGRLDSFVDAAGDVWRIVTTVVAVLLIVFGAMKVMGR